MDNYIAEYGSAPGIRFMSPESVRMYETDGSVVLCKCGQAARCAAMGRQTMIAWCSDCSPMHKDSGQFIYRPPNE